MTMTKRILIVEVNWIGDVIFSTPFIRAVRKANPEAHIACLLHPRCVEILEGNPRVDELIIYDEEGVHASLLGKLKLINELRRKRFDTAFILHRSFTKALLMMLAGIPERIGYAAKGRGLILTKAIDEPADGVHKVEYFLNIARRAGIAAEDGSYEFFIANTDREQVKGLLERNGVVRGDKFVTICPGGNWDPKRWPRQNYAKLADSLIEKHGVKIVIAGAKKDIALAEDIKGMMKHEPVITCGRTTLKQLGAIFEMSSLVVANDTGPMHLAVAMKSDTIALFGPTSPELTGPYGGKNYRVIFNNRRCDVPCYDVTCVANRCMEDVMVEDVAAEAGKVLGSREYRKEAC